MLSASIPNQVRRAIYRRDGYACALCGDPRHLQIHHFIPRGKGGGNTPRNLIVLCMYCHAAVHGTRLTEFYIPPEDVTEEADKYLSEMYFKALGPDMSLFDPYDMYDYNDPEQEGQAMLEIETCIYGKEIKNV